MESAVKHACRKGAQKRSYAVFYPGSTVDCANKRVPRVAPFPRDRSVPILFGVCVSRIFRDERLDGQSQLCKIRGGLTTSYDPFHAASGVKTSDVCTNNGGGGIDHSGYGDESYCDQCQRR